MKKIIFTLIFLFTVAVVSFAVPAYPEPFKVTQPDGTVLTIRMHGDEFLHWTTCGNSLVAKGADGWWHYASFDADGTAKALGGRVMSTPSGDGSSVTPPASAVARALEKRKATMGGGPTSSAPVRTDSGSSSTISIGEKHFLVLLIEFSDKSFTMAKSDFDDMLNGDNYTYNDAVGSVKKYYEDVSFGAFHPVYDVYGPIKVSRTSAQCADSDVEAVIEACQIADTLYNIDFTKYCNTDPTLVDNVFFFFPGYNQAEGGGSDTIWPHAVTYYSPFLTIDGVGIYRYGCASEYKGDSGEIMAGIGTFSHEFGHIIGLPDFYDVDYSKNGYALALMSLSLMSSGNYNNEGRTPPYFTFEEKLILGWDDDFIQLTEGTNTLEKTSANKAYWSPTSNDGEYYLYESRPCEGWDTYTEAPGLAIYHIDKSNYVMPSGYTAEMHWEYGYMINAYSAHQCMDLVESVYPEDEVYDYGQIVFPGRDGVTSFTSGTLPGSLAWSGAATGYNLTNISFDSATGITTFDVEKERKIVGTVKNLSGTPIAGARITFAEVEAVEVSAASRCPGLSAVRIETTGESAQYETVSDEDGLFEVPVALAGTYSVSAVREGYLKYSGAVSVDAVTELQIVMTKPVEGASLVLQKYSDLSYYSIGFGSSNDCYGGTEFTAEELTDYVGSDISSVTFMASSSNGGTADKMGVQVYFDDELQCDHECVEHIFNTLYTVDISAYGLKIPSGKSVKFVFYVLNPSYGYSVRLADYESPVTGANLLSRDGREWYTIAGNVVISASVVSGGDVINLAGFNLIATGAGLYKAGDTFELKLNGSASNPPSSVSWTVNGNPVSESSVTLTSGAYNISARLTYPNGRTETVETRINVE